MEVVEYKPGLLNVLVAFPYFNARTVRVLRERRGEYNLLIDSGAFTAWRSGEQIRLRDYCRFLDCVPVSVWRYFMLDVIEDPAATERNFRRMRERGYSPVPVFTPGSTWQQFDYYFTESDMLSCGGLANKYDPRTQAYLKAVIDRADGRPLHLLGYTSPTWVKFHKPYSCDSSTWVNGQRYGAVHLYVGGGEFRILTKGGMHAGAGMKPEYIERIAELGFDPYALQDKRAWEGHGAQNVAQHINTASFVLASSLYEKQLGVRMFLAASGEQLETLFEERDRLARQHLI